MAKTIAMAEAKWARKMATAGAKWKANVTGKGPEYCSGVAKFIGAGTCDSAKQTAWTEGVDAVSAVEFQTSVAGKGPEWRAKYIESMGA